MQRQSLNTMNFHLAWWDLSNIAQEANEKILAKLQEGQKINRRTVHSPSKNLRE